MGLLVDGVWKTDWYDTKSTGGEFVRGETQFRNWIGVDAGFEAESDRYHLYVSLACPRAHRALIFRKLKGLENVISVSLVAAEMLENGWEIDDQLGRKLQYDSSPIEGIKYLREVYTAARSDYTGRVTVPILWDKKLSRIVSNESSDIIRMLNSAFEKYSSNGYDFFPEQDRDEIERINAEIYSQVNNGVYRAGFATSQEAYEKAYHDIFDCLDRLEVLLGTRRYLLGERLSEADWRLFTTLIRFDVVYYSHFKANKKRIEEYFNLSNYVRELYQYEGVSETVDFDQIKKHYYYSHETINPSRVIPVGPLVDFEVPHNRKEILP